MPWARRPRGAGRGRFGSDAANMRARAAPDAPGSTGARESRRGSTSSARWIEETAPDWGISSLAGLFTKRRFAGPGIRGGARPLPDASDDSHLVRRRVDDVAANEIGDEAGVIAPAAAHRGSRLRSRRRRDRQRARGAEHRPAGEDLHAVGHQALALVQPLVDVLGPAVGTARLARLGCEFKGQEATVSSVGSAARPSETQEERLLGYFVTGATGFIGRHLVERLLEREGTIYVLVREGSKGGSKSSAAAGAWTQGASSRSSETSRSRASASRTRTSAGSTARSTTSSTSRRSTT